MNQPQHWRKTVRGRELRVVERPCLPKRLYKPARAEERAPMQASEVYSGMRPAKKSRGKRRLARRAPLSRDVTLRTA